jgi:hypothetical protein
MSPLTLFHDYESARLAVTPSPRLECEHSAGCFIRRGVIPRAGSTLLTAPGESRGAVRRLALLFLPPVS